MAENCARRLGKGMRLGKGEKRERRGREEGEKRGCDVGA